MANILIVDDEAYARQLLAGILEAEGHHIGTAVNGQEALQALAGETSWDVVVTDLHMPVMDGLALARELAGRPDGPLPVILVSGDPEALSMREVFTALPKPIDAEEIVTAVDAAILYRSCATWTKASPT